MRMMFSGHFWPISAIKKTRYGRTDGRTDGRMNGRTDEPSYGDASKNGITDNKTQQQQRQNHSIEKPQQH